MHTTLSQKLVLLALAAAPLVTVVSVPGCGGDAKPVTYPTGDGGARTVTTKDGAEVGIADGESSGLTGAARAAYERGWQAWLAGNLEEAKQRFEEAAGHDPKSAAPQYSLGVVLERLGDVAGAQQAYRAAFTNVPEHEPSMGAYALSLAASGHGGEADTFLESKRAKYPKSARLMTFAAEVKSLSGDHGTAQQLAQSALRLDPDYRPAMVAIASDHYRAGKAELAKYALQAILEGFGDANPPRDRDNAQAHLLRGLILREGGARSTALSDFEAAAKKRPDMVEALVNLGSMRLEAGNAQDALAPLESAARFAPKYALAHLNLGDAYRLLARPSEAKRELERALQLDSKLQVAHYDLGLLYLFTPNMPGYTPATQAAQAIKEFETYRAMRGPKAPAGVNDDLDELLNRAKAKQAEIKNASTAAAQPAKPAAPAAAPPAKPAAPPAAPAPAKK